MTWLSLLETENSSLDMIKNPLLIVTNAKDFLLNLNIVSHTWKNNALKKKKNEILGQEECHLL